MIRIPTAVCTPALLPMLLTALLPAPAAHAQPLQGPPGSVTTLLSDDFDRASLLAMGPDARVFITDGGAVGADGSQTFDGVIREVLPNGSTVVASTGMLNPAGATLGPDGFLYVTDSGARSVTNDGDGLVWRAPTDGSPATLLAGNPLGGGPFTSPTGIAPDPSDPTRVLVAEVSGTPPILINADGGVLAVSIIDGAVSIFFDDGAGGQENVIDLDVEPGGTVLTADNAVGELARLSPPASFSLVSDGLTQPVRVTVSPGGEIFARDLGNPDLLAIDAAGIPSPFVSVLVPDASITDAVFENATSLLVLVSGDALGIYRVRLCPVDFAPPFGTLNFNDVIAFLNAFAAMDPAADLAEPIGTLNFNDVIEYLTQFAQGCP